MRSAGGWSLEQEAAVRIIFPWLASEPDRSVRFTVLQWLAVLVERPIDRGVEERPGVFFRRVPGTSVGVIWTLDFENRLVILARVGPV